MQQPDLKGIKLREEYQLEAHWNGVEMCRNYQGPFIYDMSVGSGKTINICALAKHVVDKGGVAIAVARQGELVEQIAETAWSMGLRTSIFSASLNQKSISFNFIAATEGTLSRSLYVFKNKAPDILLIDECHMVPFQEIEDWIEKGKPQDEKGMPIGLETQYGQIIGFFTIKNPKLRVAGYSGSPYRGKVDILNKFWVGKAYTADTMSLVSMGYLVPPVFGFGDEQHLYDLSEFEISGGHGAHDFTSKEKQAMQRKILKDKSRTATIIEEVIERTKSRGGVLITCAGKKHCEQVAECLPEGSWGIVTDSTSTKERRETLRRAKAGEIKYTIQIGCLTTGVDIACWDTCVILRKIGSLTLLIQLIGRVLRLPKGWMLDDENEYVKSDGLVLDYTETMSSMGDIYDHPVLEKALTQRAKDKGKTQPCPACQTENSEYAVRCIGKSETELDGRCGHFFAFAMCQGCQTMNAPSAQSCRNCGEIMIDPNAKLLNKAYTDADYKPVLSMGFAENNSGGLTIEFKLDSVVTNNGVSRQEVAKEHYKPLSKERPDIGRWYAFVRAHANCPRMQRGVMNMRSIGELVRNKAIFDMPTHITHRMNDKGFSIVNRRKFLSGREAK